MVLRARLRVAGKFHFRGASRANCRIATYKASIVARITLAVNSFTIRRALFSHPCRNRRFLLSPFPEAGHRSLIIHLTRRVHFIFAERNIYHSFCGKIYEQPHREGGNCGREISPTAKNTCDRFCTPDFTILRGRGTSRAVNTFCAMVDFFDCRKYRLLIPCTLDLQRFANERRRKMDAETYYYIKITLTRDKIRIMYMCKYMKRRVEKNRILINTHAMSITNF